MEKEQGIFFKRHQLEALMCLDLDETRLILHALLKRYYGDEDGEEDLPWHLLFGWRLLVKELDKQFGED